MKDFKITYEEFEKNLNDAVAILHLQDRLYGAVAEYNDEHRESEFDFGYFPTLIENVVTLLETLTDDTNHWISYWMFDLDCGRRYVDGSVRDEDGHVVYLQTIGDLWRLLQKL